MAGARNRPDSAAYGQTAASKSRVGIMSLECRTVSRRCRARFAKATAQTSNRRPREKALLLGDEGAVEGFRSRQYRIHQTIVIEVDFEKVGAAPIPCKPPLLIS